MSASHRPQPVSINPILCWYAGACLAIFIIGVMLATQKIHFIDDAFISYRYVLNLNRSWQFVFNVGEHIEGATNLLWIIMIAFINKIIGSDPETSALVLSFSFYFLYIVLTARLCVILANNLLSGMVSGIAVFVSTDVFLSATNGLEASLYACLLASALTLFHERRELGFGLALGLLFMTRPEGGVVAAILVPAYGLGNRSWRRFRSAASPVLLLGIAVTVWRLWYFHALVPNSIIAKSIPFSSLPDVVVRDGLPYLWSFATSNAVLVSALCIGVGATGGYFWTSSPVGTAADRLRMPANTGWLALGTVGVTLASILIVLRNGGDWMPNFRLLVSYAPCYAVMLAIGVRSNAFVRWMAAALACFGVLRFAGSVWGQACCGPFIALQPQGTFFAEAAERLAPIVRPDDVVSAEAAGLLPFRLMATRIHDPIGLMDAHIAKFGKPAIPYGKTDIPYTFDTVKPAFMVWHWSGHVWGASRAARANYEAFCRTACETRDEAQIVMVRKDRLDEAARRAFSDWQPWRPLLTD